MKRLLCLLMITFALLSTVGHAQDNRHSVVEVHGEAQVEGQRAFVHLLLVIPPGADRGLVIQRALAAQGATPANSPSFTLPPFADPSMSYAEYSLLPLFWDQFSDDVAGNDFVTQYYRLSGSPVTGVEATILTTHATWTHVETSNFAFAYGGETTRCPSLFPECGNQHYDGYNDIAWISLGTGAAAATWHGDNNKDEADVALDPIWFPIYRDFFGVDLESVMLHENGHVLGLGHSTNPDAVMYSTCGCVRHELHQDDIDGITFLYPADSTPADPPTPTDTPTNTPTATATDTPTNTPTNTPTATPTDTSTTTPTNTPTNTYTPHPTIAIPMPGVPRVTPRPVRPSPTPTATNTPG